MRTQLSATQAESYTDAARIDRLEREVLALTDAFVTLLDAHKSLVTTLVIAAALPQPNGTLN